MKRFNLRDVTLLAGLVAGLALAGPASATLLGNSLQFPLLSFDNGGSLTYNGGADALSVNANPIALRPGPGAAPIFITPADGTEFVSISILVDDTGALIGGNPDGADLVVFGRIDLGGGNVLTGPLLLGEVTGFGSQDSGATDLFDFSFTVTGGALAPAFDSVIGVALQSERSSFAGSFLDNFGGGAKGTIGVIPEPTTLLLLGAGVAGLGLSGRRRAA